MDKASFRRKTGWKVVAFSLFAAIAYSGWVVLWAKQGSSLQSVVIGRSQCDHCGMVVSERRHAISVLDEDLDGNAITRHFDDPGCFMKFTKRLGRSSWTGVAYDYFTEEALAIDDALFVKGDFSTPMGSGWIVDSEGKSELPRTFLKVAIGL